MWADDIYLGITGLIIWLTMRSKKPLLYDCSLFLLFWFIMVSAIYEKDVIESDGQILISCIFMLVMGVYLYWHAHWLPIYLFLSSVAMLAWGMVYQLPDYNDAYFFKEIRNAIFVSMALSIVIETLMEWQSKRQKGNE